jgi:REP element-mobilizing transposase RayT
MADVYHVNFHTFHGKPAFLDDACAAIMDRLLGEIVERHGITCLVWSVMPTHVHCIVVTFPDQSRGEIVQLLKGASARAFLERYPAWRAEVGDHLWQEGYHWVQIKTRAQLAATRRYVQNNRPKVGLAPVPGQEWEKALD